MSHKWQTVRVFISSTFRDMQAERDHLVRFVFPRLREELLPRRVHLVDVDLRWGVTSEQDASEVCREVINECRPRFLCILGGRYGWVPPGKNRSITADEVHYGVLDRTLTDRGFAYFYFRDDAATTTMVETTPGEFREPQFSHNQNSLAQLKEAIVSAGLNPFTYPAQWDSESRRLTGLKQFGDRVHDDLLASMKSDPELRVRFVRETAAQIDEFAEEDAAMETFVEERSERFVLGSRQTVLEELLAHASATGGSGYVCLTGAPGSGKSALLAHLSQHSTLNSQPSILVIRHFVGASPGSTDVRRTLRRLCHELKAGCPDISDDIPDDLEKLRVAFPDYLRQACERHRVVILLDAINQIDPTSRSGGLYWLPEELPANVRFILSALDGPALEELRRRSRQPGEIELKPLTADDGEAIVVRFCQRYRKQFEPAQRATLLAKTDAGTPLYLLAALEELRTLGTFEEITRRIAELPPTTHELFAWILERLANDDGFRDAEGWKMGRKLVSRFAALLGASRYGLSQRELADLLAPGDPRADPPMEPDPQGNVAALLHLLRPYLMRRGELIDFYHGQFREAVEVEYLQGEDERLEAHHHLADYFRRGADPADDSTWNGTHSRAFTELPFHLLAATQYEELFLLARDEYFLRAQVNEFPRDPTLALQTVQFALEGAAAKDDAPRMSEFLLLHAFRVQSTARESPLDALRSGDLERAWGLADLFEIEIWILWHLLLAWELRDAKRTEESRATLRRLQEKEFARLCDWQSAYAAQLLLHACDPTERDFALLQARLLSEAVPPLPLCERLIELGHVAKAIGVAQAMEFSWEKGEALAAIVEEQLQQGMLVDARKAINEMGDFFSQEGLLFRLAVAHAQAGEFNSALENAKQGMKWREPNIQVRALREIAVAQAQQGQKQDALSTFDAALKIAQEIEYPKERCESLAAIAAAQAQAGESEAANATLIAAREISQEIDSAPTRSDDPTTSGIDHGLKDLGKRIQDLGLRYGSPGAIAAVQIETGEWAAAQAKRGERQAARSTLATALEMTESPEHVRASVIQDMITLLIQNGEFNAVLEIVQGESERPKVLHDIAVAQAQKGEFAAALETVWRIEDDWEKHIPHQTRAAIGEERTPAPPNAVPDDGGEKTDDSSDNGPLTCAESECLSGSGTECAIDLPKEETDVPAGEDEFEDRGAVLLDVDEFLLDPHEEESTNPLLELDGNDIPSSIAEEDFEIPSLEDLVVAEEDFEVPLGVHIVPRRIKELQAKALVAVTQARAEGGEFTAALETARMAETLDRRTRGEALCNIATAMVKQGAFDGALEVVGEVEPEQRRVELLQSTAIAQGWAGQPEAARSTFALILDHICSMNHRQARVEALADLAAAQAQAGAFADALETAHVIETELTEAQRGQEPPVESQPDGIWAVEDESVDISDEDLSLEDVTDDLRVYSSPSQSGINLEVESLDLDDNREYLLAIAETHLKALAAIAVAQVQKGEREAAETTLVAALKVALEAEHKLLAQPQSLGYIAGAQAQAGDFAAALSTVQIMRDDEARTKALVDIAIKQIDIGESATALDIAQGIQPISARAKALAEIAAMQVQVGEVEEAQCTLAKVLVIAQSMEDVKAQLSTLSIVAEIQAQAREFTAALQTAQMIESERHRADTLCTIAVAQAGYGDQAQNTAEMILTERNKHLPRIAAAFARAGDKEHFKPLLIPCAYNLGAAYRICTLLANLYPDQVKAIVEVVQSVL